MYFTQEQSGLAVKLKNAVCVIDAEAKLHPELASDQILPDLIQPDEPVNLLPFYVVAPT